MGIKESMSQRIIKLSEVGDEGNLRLTSRVLMRRLTSGAYDI
jgi:hypothetical protein